uniref:Uncharacterized protein n=1 Tax=Anguilla anguilla TaxID=7936 RepID=A0A0E9UFY8_ANGAN
MLSGHGRIAQETVELFCQKF